MTRLMCYGFLLLALVAAPWMGLYPVLGTKILCYALFACAFHLLLGYTGLASLGHAAFLGVGGYVAGYGIKAWALSPELALLAGLSVGALMGLVMGYVSIRRSGIYFVAPEQSGSAIRFVDARRRRGQLTYEHGPRF